MDQINGNSGNLRLNLDGKAYNLVYQTSSDTGLTVVGMIPTSFLQKTARELEKTYCVVNRNQHSAMCISCKYYGARNYKTY